MACVQQSVWAHLPYPAWLAFSSALRSLDRARMACVCRGWREALLRFLSSQVDLEGCSRAQFRAFRDIFAWRASGRALRSLRAPPRFFLGAAHAALIVSECPNLLTLDVTIVLKSLAPLKFKFKLCVAGNALTRSDGSLLPFGRAVMKRRRAG